MHATHAPTDEYGDATLWCWIPSKTPGGDTNWLQLWCFYLWVILAWTFNGVLLTRVVHSDKELGSMTYEVQNARKRIISKVEIHMLSLTRVHGHAHNTRTPPHTHTRIHARNLSHPRSSRFSRPHRTLFSLTWSFWSIYSSLSLCGSSAFSTAF